VSARIEVRLRPGAGRDQLLPPREGVVQARVAAPPLDGRANRALCKLVAKRLGVAPSRVSLIRGERSRDKLLEVTGIEPEHARALLGL
jgi:hypothetical protein